MDRPGPRVVHPSSRPGPIYHMPRTRDEGTTGAGTLASRASARDARRATRDFGQPAVPARHSNEMSRSRFTALADAGPTIPDGNKRFTTRSSKRSASSQLSRAERRATGHASGFERQSNHRATLRAPVSSCDDATMRPIRPSQGSGARARARERRVSVDPPSRASSFHRWRGSMEPDSLPGLPSAARRAY